MHPLRLRTSPGPRKRAGSRLADASPGRTECGAAVMARWFGDDLRRGVVPYSFRRSVVVASAVSPAAGDARNGAPHFAWPPALPAQSR